MDDILKIESVSQAFEMIGLEKPKHPLVGVINIKDLELPNPKDYKGIRIQMGLYTIIMKDGSCGMFYGRNKYDFEEGVLQFMAPGQIVQFTEESRPSTYGFMLVFHPDLIRNFDLARRMKEYTYFNYSVHESLHLSEREERTMLDTVENISEELENNIDKHSQEVLVTNLQLLLNYSNRFYERQFITRTNNSSDVVSLVEEEIQKYFEGKMQLDLGIPTPEYFAEKAHFSTNYLSDMLKKQTGKSTKDHIDEHILELAKTELAGTEKNINEVAYDLGFNYPHYFSRLFKKKTGMSPNEYRGQFLN